MGAFVPGGKLFVTASVDFTVVLWDLETETQVDKHGWNELRYQEQIGCRFTYLSPDGFTVVCPIMPDKPLRQPPPGQALWEVASGKQRGTLKYGLPAFSPGGRYFMGHEDRKTFGLWDMADGSLHRPLEETILGDGGMGWNGGGSFTGDGRYLAVIGDDMKCDPMFPGQPLPALKHYRIKVYDVRSGKTLLRITGSAGDEGFVAFAPDGRFIVTADIGSNQIRCWDAAAGDLARTLTWEGNNTRGMALSPDGKTLATVREDDRSVMLWDLDAMPELKKLKGRKPPADEKPLPTPEEPAATAKELDQFWTDLASTDAEAAYKAMWALALRPKAALPLLRERLKPIPEADAKQIAQLLADLDSNDPPTRTEAKAKLASQTRLIVKELKQTLKDTTSAEVRRRVKELLDDAGPIIADRNTLRGVRAVEALGHMNDPKARALLGELAKGAADAPETQAAKTAVERLDRLAKWQEKAP